MPRAALAVTLGLFVSAGLAHAAHLHKPESSQSGTHSVHCGLCIQFERGAAPPPVLFLQTVATKWLRVPITRQAVPVAIFIGHPYEARGPPQAT
jgi:hypothetical protein